VIRTGRQLAALAIVCAISAGLWVGILAAGAAVLRRLVAG
jgi:hypothetical protein